MYPQDPSRDRPGGFRPRQGWGDYHPCTVDFFIDRAVRRDCPENYDFVAGILSRFRGDSSRRLTPDGLLATRTFIGVTRPEQSTAWELDVCEIASQRPSEAWEVNKRYLSTPESEATPFRCVTYAREVATPQGKVLQYWYLYIYNDFLNHHEGDWEMVSISLGTDDRPVEVAYSNHHGGVRRRWEDVPRVGESPLVYVARGSHAGYFRFASGGHPLIGELSAGRLPAALFFVIYARRIANVFIKWLQRVPGIRLFRDNPPADPAFDTTAPSEKVGVRVHPEVIEMIEGDPTPDSDLWWMRYRGFWGSTRPRLLGSVGVIGPWASTSSRDLRWREPLRWMETCKLEKKHEENLVERVADEAMELLERGRAKATRGR